MNAANRLGGKRRLNILRFRSTLNVNRNARNACACTSRAAEEGDASPTVDASDPSAPAPVRVPARIAASSSASLVSTRSLPRRHTPFRRRMQSPPSSSTASFVSAEHARHVAAAGVSTLGVEDGPALEFESTRTAARPAPRSSPASASATTSALVPAAAALSASTLPNALSSASHAVQSLSSARARTSAHSASAPPARRISFRPSRVRHSRAARSAASPRNGGW